MLGTWKSVRVFVSSTFRDMQAERDWLVRFVFPKLREELMKHRIHFVDVDLRWGVTSDEDALGICRKVIDECHPRFICILGGRYGWVPEGQKESITADEIRYAVLERGAEKRGHAFFYFRDDLVTDQMVEERPGDYREPVGSINAKNLTALKETIIDACLPVHSYHAQWDATQKRLVALEAFGKQVYGDLLKSLNEDPELETWFTNDEILLSDEFSVEAMQIEEFIEERSDRFITGSRGRLLHEMLDFAAADSQSTIFVLTGAPGSGKSALLAKFARDLTTNALVIPHFVGASTGSSDLRRTLRRLCNDLAAAGGNTEDIPYDVKDLVTFFDKLLNVVASKRRVILVLDALNQLDSTDSAHWLNWLPRELPHGVRILTSVIAPVESKPEHRTLSILRSRRDTRIVPIEPLDKADIIAIIEGYLKRYSKRLSEEQIATLLAKPAGRLPLYVLTALEELRTLGTYGEITDRIRALPGTTRELFGWILTERLARDPGFRNRDGLPIGSALVSKFASCLGVSRHGLSPAELTFLLEPGDPLGNVAALLRLLRAYLMHRGELLDFYHGQFREAAELNYLDTPEKQRATHQAVANCLQVFADPHRDGQYRSATPHALSELPHHQIRAKAWPDAIATLENIFFLEAKVAHGMVFDLAEDFTVVVNALESGHPERSRLRLLNEALRRDIHFIAHHADDYPQGLFQCLWNYAWWYDCQEAESHYVVPDDHRNQVPPWARPGSKVSKLLETWRSDREGRVPRACWLRSRRPPPFPLGSALRAILRGHESPVASVAYSPDGAYIVSGSGDKTVRVWDPRSGEARAVLRGHELWITSVACNRDGVRLVSGSGDKTVRLWDARSGESLAILRGHEDTVQCVAFSPDGERIVSASYDKTVRLWDSSTGETLAVLHGHEGRVSSVAFSPDGTRIVSAAAGVLEHKDTTVRIWDALSGKELAVLRGHKATVNCVAFSPDGSRIASGSGEVGTDWDDTVRVWDSLTGETLAILRGHDGRVTSVAFSPDDAYIVSGSADKTVRLWDAWSGAELAVLRGHESRGDCYVAFSPDGERIVSGAVDKAVRIWDAHSGDLQANLREHASPVTRVAFSPDGRRLVSLGSSYDRTALLWDTNSGAEVAALRGHEQQVRRFAFSPDGLRIVTETYLNNPVRLWDAESGTELALLHNDEFSEAGVAGTPYIARIAVGPYEVVRLWDTHWGNHVGVIQGKGNECAIDAGQIRYRYQAKNLGDETTIERVDRPGILARFPVGLEGISTHPADNSWAGYDGFSNHLYLVTLEGESESP